MIKYLTNISKYCLRLEQYRKYFPLEDILILDFDEVRANPTLLLQRIYEFLDLWRGFFPKAFKVKNRTQIKSRFEKNLMELTLTASFFGYIPKPLEQL